MRTAVHKKQNSTKALLDGKVVDGMLTGIIEDQRRTVLLLVKEKKLVSCVSSSASGHRFSIVSCLVARARQHDFASHELLADIVGHDFLIAHLRHQNRLFQVK